jgi:hypothetical protein
MWPTITGLLIAGVILATPNRSTAQLSVNDYRALTEDARTFYVVGVFSGWSTAAILMEGYAEGTRTRQVLAIVDQCGGRMTRNQMRGVVDKYLQANPKNRPSQGAHYDYVFLALAEACK